MSEQKLVLLDNLKPESVTVGNVKDNRSGMGKSANMSYDNSRFSMVLQNVRFPFGASAKKEEYRQGDKDQWSLQCELTKDQIQVLKELDEHIIDECLKNEGVTSCLVQKGKKASREVLESKYYSCLKYSKDKDGNIKDQYDPTLRIAIPNDKGDGFSTSFFVSTPEGTQMTQVDNIKGSEHNIGAHIPPNSRGSALVGISVWVTATGFGMSMRLNQLKTEPSKQLDKSVCLLDRLLQSGESNFKPVEDPGNLSDGESNSDVPSEHEVEEKVESESEVEEEIESASEEPTPPPKKKSSTKKPKKAVA